MWKSKFGFTFNEVENVFRKMVFLKNVEIIKNHNSDPSRTYDMGLNQFSAYTDAEFVSIYLNPKPYNPEWENVDTTYTKVGADIDWTTKGMVSPVKNQGQCGSCWAFSAVACLESFGLAKGVTAYLSEQQLVDCSRKYGNQGCSGGFNYQGLAYVKDHGIAT
jgi:C1A family cysteine protease